MSSVTIITECPFCHDRTTFELSESKFQRWQSGEHIQNVWPEMPAAAREQLISGCCPDCWNAYMIDPDDEDD